MNPNEQIQQEILEILKEEIAINSTYYSSEIEGLEGAAERIASQFAPSDKPHFDLSYEDVIITIQEMDWNGEDEIHAKELMGKLLVLKNSKPLPATPADVEQPECYDIVIKELHDTAMKFSLATNGLQVRDYLLKRIEQLKNGEPFQIIVRVPTEKEISQTADQMNYKLLEETEAFKDGLRWLIMAQ